jgi:hypothetical protein
MHRRHSRCSRNGEHAYIYIYDVVVLIIVPKVVYGKFFAPRIKSPLCQLAIVTAAEESLAVHLKITDAVAIMKRMKRMKLKSETDDDDLIPHRYD